MVPAPVPAAQARRARWAVGALFLTNGALFANVVPRYPEIRAQLELSNTAFGSAVAAYGAGALLVGLLGGPLVHRFGSARVALVATLAVAANLSLVAAAPSWLLLAAVLLVAGGLDAIADVSENAHGLRVERLYGGRSVLNSMHALWSVGAVVGGLMSVAAASLDVPLAWHLPAAGLLLGGLAVAVSHWLLPGHDSVERPPAPPGTGAWQRLSRLAGSVLVFGAIAAMAQLMEDVAATWSALYLREELLAATAVAGLGFVALQAAQTVGRLAGDPLVTRWGDRHVARLGAGLAAVAMTLALVWPAVIGTIAAFGVVGLGIGTLIPASMRAIDRVPGLPAGLGLTLVGTVVRVSILSSPLVVGLLADATSLRVALVAIPVAGLIVVSAAGALPGRPSPAAVRAS